MTYRKKTPEAWHAEVLRDEINQLTLAVRELEFSQGYDLGRGVISDVVAVANLEKPTGTPTAATGQGA